MMSNPFDDAEKIEIDKAELFRLLQSRKLLDAIMTQPQTVAAATESLASTLSTYYSQLCACTLPENVIEVLLASLQEWLLDNS